MITSSQIYWITRLDSIGCFFAIIGTIITIVSAICLIVALVNKAESYTDDDDKTVKKWFLIGIKTAFISSLFWGVAVFVPSTKEMAAILILPKIVNNEKVQKIPDQMLTLANEWMQELRPKPKKEDN